MKTLLKRKISLVVIILQLLVTVLFCVYVGMTGLVPLKYMIPLVIVSVLLLVY